MAAIARTPQDATNYIWWAWLVSWFAAALWSDRTVRRPSLRRQAAYRVTTIFGALLLFGWLGIRRYDIRFWRLDGALGWLFVALAAAGVLFMWWARLHLGRLWSGSVTRKTDHHIIDTGPYAFVRHPIYTGLLCALAATVCVRATAETLAGAAILALGIYIKARTEESFLRDQLGAETYDVYARRVPMLVPFARRLSGATR
jgi:protein-S-isoprenylcysteine O-methyltransferase Ste14